jgi:putative DNA primase/helicase
MSARKHSSVARKEYKVSKNITDAAPSTALLLTAARAWYEAGFAVIPSHEDGGKRPMGRWKDYTVTRPTWQEIEGWLSTGRYSGIGVICGAVSGNAELIEIEGPSGKAIERLGRVMARAGEAGMGDLLSLVARGCSEESAGGGLHLFIRVSDGPALGNRKLAFEGQACMTWGVVGNGEKKGGDI